MRRKKEKPISKFHRSGGEWSKENDLFFLYGQAWGIERRLKEEKKDGTKIYEFVNVRVPSKDREYIHKKTPEEINPDSLTKEQVKDILAPKKPVEKPLSKKKKVIEKIAKKILKKAKKRGRPKKRGRKKNGNKKS